MTVAPSTGDNDRRFCWEQVNRTNPCFRVSHVFAPGICADRLLPLYALFSVFEQMGSSFSDEEVAASKLNWWRLECLRKDRGESRHPIMEELDRTGAQALLPQERLVQLLDGVGYRLNGPAPADMDALKHICIGLQQPQFDLELAVTGTPGVALPDDRGYVARAGLLQLIRESARSEAPGAWWWVPLNSLARHALGREDISAKPGTRRVAALFTEIFGLSGQWGRGAAGKPRGPAGDISPARHLFAINGLYSRQLERLRLKTPDLFAAELKRRRMSDIFHAWMGARRLKWH
jgi:hypothetical protein